jgi:tetratricopeptide (TPR) repeat protein
MARLEREHDNLRAALDWAQEAGGLPGGSAAAEIGLWLGAALQEFWCARGYASEGHQRLRALLALEAAAVRTAARAKALVATAWLGGRLDHALFQEALGISQELNDVPLIAASLLLAETPPDCTREEEERARAYLEQGLTLFRKIGDAVGICRALHRLGGFAIARRDDAAALAFGEECLAIRRARGDLLGIAQSLNNLGHLAAAHQANFERARVLFEEALPNYRRLGAKPGMAMLLSNLAEVYQDLGEYQAMRGASEESLQINKELGNKWGIAVQLCHLGMEAMARGDWEPARAFFEEGDAVDQQLGRPHWWNRSFLGRLALKQGDLRAAEATLIGCLAGQRARGDPDELMATLAWLSELRRHQGDLPRARAHLREALALRGSPALHRRAILLLWEAAMLCAASGEYARAVQFFAAAVTLGAPPFPVDRPDQDRCLDHARERLGDTAFDIAWAAGQAMALDQALDFALDGINLA